MKFRRVKAIPVDDMTLGQVIDDILSGGEYVRFTKPIIISAYKAGIHINEDYVSMDIFSLDMEMKVGIISKVIEVDKSGEPL